MSLQEIKQALRELLVRIKLQRKQEKRKVERAEWTADLNRARDLIDLVELAEQGVILL